MLEEHTAPLAGEVMEDPNVNAGHVSIMLGQLRNR